MADRVLDRDKHPQWQGERTKMVYAFSTETELWKEYAQVRADGLRNEQGLAPATAFYTLHQEALEAGAQIAWPERFNHDELSAIQHVMNLKLQNEQAFFAEYQNEPLPEVPPDGGLLSPGEIARKLSRLAVGTVPLRANHLTLFIDVQGSLLYYLVAAWEGNFTGQVIDYGAYPRQQRHYFSLRDAQPKLAEVIPGAGQEGLIYAGLENLTSDLLARSWRREDGTLLSIERCLIDANWGLSTEVVYQFCRQSAYKAVLIPSHGRDVGVASTPFSDYKQHPGEKLGHSWRIPSVAGKRAIRHVIYDTNF